MMKLRYDGKLVILTCFYEMRAYSPYVQSLVRTIGVLDKLGIAWDYWPSHGVFYVEHATNEALTRAMNDETVTDVLMIDSDESWTPEDAVRLLMHPDEVVGGAYRKKNGWEHYTCNLMPTEDDNPEGRMLADGTALLCADGLPGGFLRLQTTALRKFHDAYPEARRKDANDVINTTFFSEWTDPATGTPFSSDLGFCKRLQAIGVPLWVDPTLKIDHWGITKYEGDFDKYLRDQLTFAQVRKMAK